MGSRDSSNRKGKERATEDSDYQEEHLVGKGRKRRNAGHSGLDSTSPTETHRPIDPRPTFEVHGERPQYHSSHDYPALARSNTEYPRIYAPPTPLVAAPPVPSFQGQGPMVRSYSSLPIPQNYSRGGETVHSHDQRIYHGLAGPPIPGSEYLLSPHGPGYNVPHVSRLDWNQHCLLSPYLTGPHQQTKEGTSNAATTTLGGIATEGEPRRVPKKYTMWSRDDTYLLKTIGQAQVSWEMRSSYFPGHSVSACQRKYWEEVD